RKGQVSSVTPGPEKSSGKQPGVTRARGERAGRSPDGRRNATPYPGYRTNSHKYAPSLPLGSCGSLVLRSFASASRPHIEIDAAAGGWFAVIRDFFAASQRGSV